MVVKVCSVSSSSCLSCVRSEVVGCEFDAPNRGEAASSSSTSRGEYLERSAASLVVTDERESLREGASAAGLLSSPALLADLVRWRTVTELDRDTLAEVGTDRWPGARPGSGGRGLFTLNTL